jgi:hypothetical protein
MNEETKSAPENAASKVKRRKRTTTNKAVKSSSKKRKTLKKVVPKRNGLKKVTKSIGKSRKLSTKRTGKKHERNFTFAKFLHPEDLSAAIAVFEDGEQIATFLIDEEGLFNHSAEAFLSAVGNELSKMVSD